MMLNVCPNADWPFTQVKVEHAVALAWAKKLVEDQVKKSKMLSQDEIEDAFSSRLMTAGLPDPDILIRTSGEKRISNFLLWQCAYTEFVFMDTLWPDFTKTDLEKSIKEFLSRDRRYGGVKQAKAQKN